jgi:hypothetical protein
MKPLFRLLLLLTVFLSAVSATVIQQHDRASGDRTNLVLGNSGAVIAPTARPQLVAAQDDISVVYYASKKSTVFHRSTCQYVAQIHPENLISFQGRAAAVNSGRRPCKVCKP